MKRKPNITPGQLEIMNLIWDRGELGVAEVWSILAQQRKIARNTVQTTLTRLVEKGWLQTRVVGNAYRFRASRPRKNTLREMVRHLLETAFGGSPSKLVTALLDERKLSPIEAERIRELIDKAERGARK